MSILRSKDNPEFDADFHPNPCYTSLRIVMRIGQESSLMKHTPPLDGKIFWMYSWRYWDIVCCWIPSMTETVIEISVIIIYHAGERWYGPKLTSNNLVVISEREADLRCIVSCLDSALNRKMIGARLPLTPAYDPLPWPRRLIIQSVACLMFCKGFNITMYPHDPIGWNRVSCIEKVCRQSLVYIVGFNASDHHWFILTQRFSNQTLYVTGGMFMVR